MSNNQNHTANLILIIGILLGLITPIVLYLTKVFTSSTNDIYGMLAMGFYVFLFLYLLYSAFRAYNFSEKIFKYIFLRGIAISILAFLATFAPILTGSCRDICSIVVVFLSAGVFMVCWVIIVIVATITILMKRRQKVRVGL